MDSCNAVLMLIDLNAQLETALLDYTASRDNVLEY